MKYRGCAYYPEYWGVQRIPIDADLMQKAGINVVRVGEFAWSRMEPEEGQYQLDWLHETFREVAKRNIGVLLCTPTATPPAWLTTANPGVLAVSSTGARRGHGSRRHYCPTSETYRVHSDRIVEKLTREFSGYPNLIGWQLDNEFGPESGWCHCDACQAGFARFLKARYGSVEGLNSAWKTGFWSHDYTDWRQVRLAEDHQESAASRRLDSRRFWSQSFIDFAMRQSRVIRSVQPRATITTNGMGPLYSAIDYYQLFDGLDVASDDLYFDITTMDGSVMAMNSYRNYKPGKAFWITETGSGALDHNKGPSAKQFRAWAWSSYAHGAEAFVIFRWRTCLSGQEQELQGIVEHSGKPRHRYRAVAGVFNEFADLPPQLKDLPLPRAEVAIVYDCQSHWAYESARVGNDVKYSGRIGAFHRMLYERNIVTDIVSAERDFSSYRLLIVANAVITDNAFAARLGSFIKSGGIVLTMGQLGMRDENNNYHGFAGPAGLQNLLGLTLEGGTFLTSHVNADEGMFMGAQGKGRNSVEVAMEGTLGEQRASGMGKDWIGDVEVIDAEVLMRFTSDVFAGQPALVSKRHGEGTAFYLAAVDTDAGLLSQILDHVLALARATRLARSSAHVEVTSRGNVLFVINHTNQAQEVELSTRCGEALIGQCVDGRVTLEAFGVAAIMTK